MWGGIVAEKRQTWISDGSCPKMSLISSMKPLSNISSASSRTIILRWSVLRHFLSIISFTRPGVPTTTWTPPSLRILLSSLGSVPPMQQWTEIFKYSLKHQITFLICWASYRVGARTSAWHCGDLGSISCSKPIEKVAVLPVPDCAWATVSFLEITGRIPRCWIMDGF